MIMSCDCSSCKDYSLGLTPFNRKWLEKCSLEKCQLYQPKPAVVEIVDLNRTQPYLSNTVAQDARERVQRLQRKENTTEESL